MNVKEIGEQALAIRKLNPKFTYFQIDHLSYEVTDRYPDMPSNVWILAGWFYKAYSQDLLSKKGDYMVVSAMLAISRLSLFHIRSPSTVTRLFQRLVDDGFLLEKRIPNPRKSCGFDSAYKPTDLMRELCVYDLTLSTQNAECNQSYTDTGEVDTPSKEDMPITLSEDLFTFYAALKQATNAYNHHSDPEEKPSKLWQSVDHCIHELMDGTFYDNHKDSLDKKYQDITSIPKQTMEDIVKVCANTVNPCSRDKKPSISSLFLRYKSGLYTSPYLDYLLTSLPPSLPEISSKVLEKARASYAFIEDASTASYNICQFYDKIKGLTERIDYCYYITDKIYTFYDDSTMESMKDVGTVMLLGQRKSFTKYWVAAFIDYNDFMHKLKKPSKWPTFDAWIASTKVGDSNEGSPWYNTMRYAYRMRGWCMTENKTAFAEIKSSVETAKEKKNSNGGY